MASYRPIQLEGLLMREGRQLILQMPDGGQWRLFVIGNKDHLLGRHVLIEGARDGHDGVAVDRITAKCP